MALTDTDIKPYIGLPAKFTYRNGEIELLAMEHFAHATFVILRKKPNWYGRVQLSRSHGKWYIWDSKFGSVYLEDYDKKEGETSEVKTQ